MPVSVTLPVCRSLNIDCWTLPLKLVLRDKPRAETSSVNRAQRHSPSLLGTEPSNLVPGRPQPIAAGGMTGKRVPSSKTPRGKKWK